MLEIKIVMILPFWVNLRNGIYPIRHKNLLKEELQSKSTDSETQEFRILIDELEEFPTYGLGVNNFIWKIGFDHLFAPSPGKGYLINENLEKNEIISDEEKTELFGTDKNYVFHQKLKTVITHEYKFKIDLPGGEAEILKRFIKYVSDPVVTDFIQIMKEFLLMYIGFVSSKDWCNEAHLLSETAFDANTTFVKIFYKNKEVTDDVGFPNRLHNHPFYPKLFLSPNKEIEMLNYLKDSNYPSFSRILIGFSYHHFAHGDYRIAVLYLDNALESAINRFLKKYNKNLPKDKRIKPISSSSSKSLGDFLKKDLPNIDSEILPAEEQDIQNVIVLHNERNLIIHQDKHKKLSNIEQLRESTEKIVNRIDSYLDKPILITDPEKDYVKITMGRAAETIKGGDYGKIQLFSSFSELKKHSEQVIRKKKSKKQTK